MNGLTPRSRNVRFDCQERMDPAGDIQTPPQEAGEAESEPPQRGPRSAGLVVEIVRDAGDWSVFEPADASINQAAAALFSHPRFASAPAAEACIALSSDAAVRELNRSYRSQDKPTNVLSFPALAPLSGGPADAARFLGDVVLSVETCRSEARELGLQPAHHLQHLVVHGLLHLLGLDHETDADAQVMESVETEILASIGVADPYAGCD